MSNWLGIEELVLSSARPKGYVPRPSASLRRRILAHGVVDPIVVRWSKGGRYEILSNPESWVAAGHAGLRRVPVFIRDDLTDDEAREISRAHYGVKATNPIDEAEEFASQLEAFGGRKRRGAITKLAVWTGRGRSYVEHSLRLLELPGTVRNMIGSGVFTAGHARPLITIKGREQQIQLAQTILSQKLSVRGAEELAREHRGAGRRPTEGPTTSTSATAAGDSKSPDIRRLERDVSDLVNTEFEIRGSEAVFQFYGDLNVLQGILDRLGYRPN